MGITKPEIRDASYHLSVSVSRERWPTYVHPCMHSTMKCLQDSRSSARLARKDSIPYRIHNARQRRWSSQASCTLRITRTTVPNPCLRAWRITCLRTCMLPPRPFLFARALNMGSSGVYPIVCSHALVLQSRFLASDPIDSESKHFRSPLYG